jgi:two-component system phosphate regulon sensor histidine kinase PhoR
MRRLAVQLFVPVFVVALAFVLVAAFYWSSAFERLYLETLSERLALEARLVADGIPWDRSGSALDEICRTRSHEFGGRVTVIAADGRVIGESEEPSAGLENHRDRPEVVAASRDGLGQAMRFSHTVGYDMLYVAVRDRHADGNVRFVRIALPLRALREAEQGVRGILEYGVLLAIVLGGGSAWWFSRRLARRIRHIEEFSRGIVSGTLDGADSLRGDEIGRLEAHLFALAREIRAQLAATENERAKLEAVLRNMGDGVVVLDGAGDVVLLNGRAREQLGFVAGDQVEGRKLSSLCRNPDLLDLLDEIEGEGLQEGIEGEVVLDGAERRFLSVSAAPLADEEAGGARPGAILVLHDVTRVRRLESVRAEFVANVSHELRTPLTAIRGYAETLLSGALSDPAKATQFLQVIERHSERLSRLIDDLLTLSDLELGKADIVREALPLGSVADAVFEVLGTRARERSIELRSEIHVDAPPLFADRDRVEQVLLNLVDNAIKYSSPGGRVVVGARAAPAGGVEISVADDGIGIPEKDLPRLTERFYRVDRARSRELGGTGLGLAIVKHIVQAHRGSLSITSRVGEGTTVRVVFPAAPRATEARSA